MSIFSFKKNLEKVARYNGFSSVGVTSPDFADIKIKNRFINSSETCVERPKSCKKENISIHNI